MGLHRVLTEEHREIGLRIAKFENRIRDIIRDCNDKPNLSKDLNEILDIFDTKPIVYPYLYLPENADAFYSSLSSSKRYFYRRYMKKERKAVVIFLT